MILVHITRWNMSFLITLLIQLNYAVKRSNPLKTRFVILVHRAHRYEICDIFRHTVVISRKTVKSIRNTICDTCLQNSGRYEFCDIFLYIVVKSPWTVKYAKNTICDTCSMNSGRYKICDSFPHTVVISCKTVKSAKNTICDTCSQNSRRYEFLKFLLLKL